MFSQALSVILCLSLLLPVGSAAESGSQRLESDHGQNVKAGIEKAGGSAFDRTGHPTQPDEQQKTMAMTQTYRCERVSLASIV